MLLTLTYIYFLVVVIFGKYREYSHFCKENHVFSDHLLDAINEHLYESYRNGSFQNRPQLIRIAYPPLLTSG